MSDVNKSAIPPRILLCVHQFFPEFSAGTEVLVLSTAKALQAIGYEVNIVTGALSDAPTASNDAYNFQGFTVHRILTPYRQGQFGAETALNEYDNSEISPFFAVILDQFSPDLVHFFHFKNLTLGCLKECFLRKIPTVFTPTDYWLNCRTCQLLKPWGEAECVGPGRLAGRCLRHILLSTKSRFIRPLAKALPTFFFSSLILLMTKSKLTRTLKLQRLATDLKHRQSRIFDNLKKLDLLFPPTQSLENMLLDNGIDPARILPLRYAIEQPAVDYELIASSADRRFLTIGFIGTLVEHKGCHVLLEALKSISYPAMEVRIYGDPDHYPEYVNSLKVAAGEDSRIRFCGTFAPGSIGNVLGELDALVIPSTWRENAPLVLLNAIASGTPVIASDVSGITEYLDLSDNVALFPAGDSRQLAELIDERARLWTSPRKALQGTSRTAGNSLETYARTLDTEYTRLIQRPYGKMENI